MVTHWNGSPIELAVARNGAREAGSNADARRAQGVEALTLRWLGMSLPPGEDWVNLTYTNGTKTFDSRFDWEIYSTTDIFSAGLQDQQIGKVLGCHSSTGAGGANVWDYSMLHSMTVTPENPFTELPGGATMRVAVRRCTRVGLRSGIPVEDYGVVPDVRYFMTRKDVVGNNDDLIASAAGILKQLPKQSLRLTSDAADRHQKIAIDCSNVDRIDLFVNDRPALSQEVSSSQANRLVQLPFAATAGSVLRADGYRDGALVVSTRLVVGP